MKGRQGKKFRLLTSRWEEQGSSHGRDNCLWKKLLPTNPREEECRHFCRVAFLQPAGAEWTPSLISLCNSSFTRINSYTQTSQKDAGSPDLSTKSGSWEQVRVWRGRVCKALKENAGSAHVLAEDTELSVTFRASAF